MGLFRPHLRPDSLEDLFLERYGDLLRAALAITGGRREAEDLVQDAFVRVMLAAPDLASIEHPDAYLRTILRNLHTARLRRRAYRAETPLSIVDFDSAHFAAAALTPSQWTQARHDLAAACRYACTRRLSSKTGSLFLLRFVHELVPTDIARVTRLTRATVDITLGRARAEVKAYLEQPAPTLQALGGELVPMMMPAATPGADEDDDYLAHIREAVFSLRHARCIETVRLQRLYASASMSPSTQVAAIPTQILAEIVTCPQCLDRVTRLTQTPLRADQPPDAEPPSQGSRPPLRLTTRDAGQSRRSSAAQACRAVRAHRPRLLRVLVNGFEVATHEISGPAARVTQTVSAMEPVWLVEVYSEQEVCLASLDVAPLPDAPAEQRVAVALADDRRIELALSFLKQWPTLSLVYEDPTYVAAAATVGVESAEFAEIAETGVAGLAGIGEDWESRHDSPAIAPAAASVPAAAAAALRRVFRARGWARGWTDSTASALRRPPRLAWWAVSMAVIAWLFFFTPGTPVSAAERLWRALAALVASKPTPAPMPRGGPARQQNITLPAPTTKPPERAASSSQAALPPGALAELEVDALTALQARHVLAGQRIQVTRTPTNVAVEGLVEGGDRDELVRALRDVPHGATLRVNLSTPEELIGSRAANTPPGATGTAVPAPSSLRAVSLGRDAVPAADDLRRAVVSRGAGAGASNRPTGSNPPTENVEAEMYRIANDGLRYARTAFLEAATLSTLVERFDAARASGIPGTAATKWRSLLTEQADRVARGVDRMRTLLEPVFVPYEEGTASAPASVSGTEAGARDQRRLDDEARRIAEDLRQVEHATRAALAVAETAPITIELRERAFWRRLAGTRDRIAALTEHVAAR